MSKDHSITRRAGVFGPLLLTLAALAAFAVTAIAQTPTGRGQAPAPAGTAAGQAQPGGGAAQPGQAGQPAEAARRGGGGGGRGGPSWAGQTPLNVLVVSGGCCHDYPGQNRLIYDTFNRVAPINWTQVIGMTNLSVSQGKLPLYADPAYASKFDLVIHNECWASGDFPPSFMQNMAAGHDRGIPAIMIHCSLHSYRSSPLDFWRELIGVTSRRHTFAHQIKVTWNQDDPITKGLPEWTTPTDELYVIEKVWPGTKQIATAINNQRNTQGALDNGVSGPNETYPVAWTQLYKGSSRVFGTSLGHANPTWEAPQFQELMIRGFRWVMGKDPLVGWTPTPAGMSAPAPAGGGGGGRRGAAPEGGAAPAAPARGATTPPATR